MALRLLREEIPKLETLGVPPAVLDLINLHKGIVLVTGETGSGKSTIANLLARFYDVDSGSIAIDGVDIRDYTISSLRGMIGVVNQDAIMFNETIAENIAYGKPDATRDEIIAAAKLANAHEFIVNGPHPDGYETEVGEKGFKLSGGEKQRVSIARAPSSAIPRSSSSTRPPARSTP